MSKNKKPVLVPKLRFPKFRRNRAVCFENGNVIFESISNKDHNSDLPILAITQEHGAISRDKIDYNVSVTSKSLENYKIVEIGDFIISLRSFQGGIEYSLYHGICSPAYIVLRKKIPIVEQYYKYYFKTHKFINDINKDLEGIRDGKMVSYSQFTSILLPKPETKEQQKIADCLSSLDDLISAEKQKLETLKSYKKGLLQQLFPAEGKRVPKLRFPGYAGAWEQRKLGRISKTTIGEFVIKTKQKSDSPYPVYNGGISYTGFYDDFNNEGNKILISARGANAGFVNIIKKRYWAGNSCYSVDLYNKNDYDIDFVYQYMKRNQDRFLDNQQAANIPSVSKADVENFTLEIPNYNEQKVIAQFFSNLDRLITLHQYKLEVLDIHKKGLLQGLFPAVEDVPE